MRLIQFSLAYSLLVLLNPLLFAQPADLQGCFGDHSSIKQHIATCENELTHAAAVIQDQSDINKDAKLQIDLLLKLTSLYTHQGDFEKANQKLSNLDTLSPTKFSPHQRYNFFRRKGILQYRQGQLPASLISFDNAKEIAEKTQQQGDIGKSLSDIGTAHLAMMEYPEALEAYKKSLAIKEHSGHTEAIAVTLNNIGSVYRDLSDWEQAESYYQKAIQLYQQLNKPSRVAHSQENLGVIFLEKKMVDKAISVFIKSLRLFQDTDNQHAQLRILILLGRAYLIKDQLQAAENYLKQAEKLELEVGNNAQSIPLKLQLAKLLSMKGSYQRAESLLLTGLAQAESQKQRELVQKVLFELVANAVRFSQWQAAFQYQKELSKAQLESRKIAFDESLVQKRALFEYEQQQKTIALLNKDKKINALELKNKQFHIVMLVLVAVIILVILGSMIFWLWRKRVRLSEEYAKEIEYHRNKVKQLGISYSSLKSAFGQFNQPILVFNTKNELIFSNKAVSKFLDIQSDNDSTVYLEQIIPKSNTEFWKIWLSDDEIESQLIKDIPFLINDNTRYLNILVSILHREEPIGLIVLCDQTEDHRGISMNALLPVTSFHQMLVDLMIESLDIWEKSTNTSRIDLAEKSGIWRVSIDEGRLRTRSLDRYLAIKSLPKKPRWREVVRTAHFVLAECRMEEESKKSLEKKLDVVTEHLRAEALV